MKVTSSYLNEVFSLFSHMNAIQRDMCPSATRFESEIGAMTLDLMHADAVRMEKFRARLSPRAVQESIISALLVFEVSGAREDHSRQK